MAVPGVVSSLKREVTISRQSIYEYSNTKNHEIGTRLRLGDRIFRYAANSTVELAPGLMTSGPTTVANYNNVSVTTSASAGQMYVDITAGATACTENQFAGGYLWFNAGGTTIGEGCAYRIKSHLAVSAAGGTMRVHLYDPLATALTATTSKATLYANPWSAIVIHPATPTNRPTGVPLITVTASTATTTYYCWLQTGGFVPLSMETTYTIGGGVGAVSGTAGEGIVAAAGVPTALMGVVAQIGSASDHPSLVWLYLDM